jgi:hypothetical protein
MIDGALTKDNYIKSIQEDGFTIIEILDENLYLELVQKGNQEGSGRRKITSLTIKAIKE